MFPSQSIRRCILLFSTVSIFSISFADKFVPPEPERIVLKNGAVLFLLEDHELPFIDLSVRMPMTPADEENMRLGSVGLFSEVWRTGGTKTLKPEDLNKTLENLAASVETGAGEEAATLSLHCLSKDFDQVLGLAKDVLLEPRFDEAQLALAKGKTIEGIRRRYDTIYGISRRAVRDVIYGNTHYYARSPTEEQVKAVSRADLKSLHSHVVTPEGAVISLSGDFNSKDIIDKLNEKLVPDWEPTDRLMQLYNYDQLKPWEGKVFFVQKEANQSRLVFVQTGVKRHTPDHFALEVANMVLGGGGPSRLFSDVRSRLGLAYMVGSFCYENKGPSLLGVVCQTKSETTIKALQAIREELVRFCSAPPTEEELAVAKDSIINSFIFKFDSIPEIVRQKADIEFYGYPPDYLSTYVENIRRVTAMDVLRVAKIYFNDDRLKIVVVGNAKKFDGDLNKMGEKKEVSLKELD